MADTNVGLIALTTEMRSNSERWFPQIHDGSVPLATFYTLGLAGEAGEVANVVKKLIRGKTEPTDEQKLALGRELADVFTYLLLLAGEVGVDLVGAYREKAQFNEERWG